MALQQCPVCDRAFPEHRARCPNCGFENIPDADANGKAGAGVGGSRARSGGAILLVVMLAALNVWQARTDPSGPDPEEEALHSPAEALQECRGALEVQLSGGGGLREIVSPFEVEYLHGGEYQVTATLHVEDEADGRSCASSSSPRRPDGPWSKSCSMGADARWATS